MARSFDLSAALAALSPPVARGVLLDPIVDLAVGPNDHDGSLPDGEYYLVVVGVDGNGNETAKSNEVHVTAVDGDSDFELTLTPILGAVSYRIYYGSTPGGQTHYVTDNGYLPPLMYFYDLTDAVAGSPPPAGTAAAALSGDIGGISRNIRGANYFLKTTADEGSINPTADFSTVGIYRHVSAGDATETITALSDGLVAKAGAAVSGKSHLSVRESGLIIEDGISGQLPNTYMDYHTASIGADITGGGPLFFDWYSFVNNANTLPLVYYKYQGAPTGAGSIDTLIYNWHGDLAGKATNPYYDWDDSRGVRRRKEDATFDSVGQSIEALYNPQFTKYTPGAADHERIILGQWNGNVAEIGTEKGGTGTLRALRLIGAGVMFPLSDPEIVGAWWDNGTTLVRSTGP